MTDDTDNVVYVDFGRGEEDPPPDNGPGNPSVLELPLAA